jgi:uncharacterized protein (DUF1778 family)
MAKPKTDRLNIRISPELKAEIEAAADKEDKTLSQYILDAIREALKRSKRGNSV